jgi:methionyl-tRNA synthetase
VGCEAFKTAEEIIDGKCVLHPTRVLEWVEEKNWFFRLSAYTEQLRELVSREEFLQPKSRRNEILSLIDQGLEDVSASRARQGWGIPFPRGAGDGAHQTTYVWFDALPNYITGLGYPHTNEGFDKWWPADVHIIGKDITRFHALIWPAMLMAAELPLPRSVWAHGFVLLGGERFSKSSGVTLDLHDATYRYGPDAFRYFLMREVPFDSDGAFSWERFTERYVSDLANSWGNLASRTMAMVEKYCSGFVPAGPTTDVDIADEADYEGYHAAMMANMPSRALEHVWNTIARANEYVDAQAPWKLAKSAELRGALNETLSSLVRGLVRQTLALSPFMPGKSAELLSQLGAPPRTPYMLMQTVSVEGWRVMKGDPLFPKDKEEVPE